MFAALLTANAPSYQDFLVDRDALRQHPATTGAGSTLRRAACAVNVTAVAVALLLVLVGVLLVALTAWLIDGILQRAAILDEARAAVDFAGARRHRVKRGIPCANRFVRAGSCPGALATTASRVACDHLFTAESMIAPG